MFEIAFAHARDVIIGLFAYEPSKKKGENGRISQYGELAIFPIFRPSYLSAFIRYQAKQGGIL